MEGSAKQQIDLLQEQTKFGLTKEELSKYNFLILSKIAIDTNSELKFSMDITEHGRRYNVTMKVEFEEVKTNAIKTNFQILDFIRTLCRNGKKQKN